MYEYNCIIDRIVDADTIEVRIDLGFGIWKKETCRLANVDSPEMKTPEGKVAKNRMSSKILFGQIYKIKVLKREKYGRSLVEIFDDKGESLSDWLLKEGLAKEYSGGKR